MEVHQEEAPTEEDLEVLQDLNLPEVLIEEVEVALTEEVAEVDFLQEVEIEVEIEVEASEVDLEEVIEEDQEVGLPEADPQEEEVAEDLEVAAVVEVVVAAEDVEEAVGEEDDLRPAKRII